MGPVEKILRDAWKLIEDPKNRAVGFGAFDKDGNIIAANSPEACQWCSYGAVVCVTNEPMIHEGVEFYLRQASFNIFGNRFVSHHNDRDVINNPPKIYKEAIRLAEKDGV